MKQFMLSALLLLLSMQLFAQDKFEDVVYLKNGSIIRGVMLEFIPDQSVKIQTADRNIFVFKMEEVEKITKEPIGKPQRVKNKQPSAEPETGHDFILELGYGLGVGKVRADRGAFNFVYNYRLNRNVGIGIGTGLRYYTTLTVSGNGNFLLPLFADFRFYFNDNDIAPFAGLDFGASMFVGERYFNFRDQLSGILINPFAGVIIKTNKGGAFSISAGYDMQRYLSANLGAIQLKAGYTF
jgi:hypothetical protein